MAEGWFQVGDLVRCYAPPNLLSVVPGNRVMLRSGGPEMTVCDTDGERATCQWLTGDGAMQSGVFQLVCLTCYGAR